MCIIKKNDGFALVFTLLLIVIFVSLIGVLINISLRDFTQAERNKNDVKAYFLARSGAELIADYIIDESIDSLLPTSSTPFTIKEEPENNLIDIEITPITTNAEEYNIKSTAEVQGISKTVNLNIIKKEPFDDSIFTYNDLNIDHTNANVSINDGDKVGKLVSNEKIIDSDPKIENENNKISYADRYYPPLKLVDIKNDGNFQSDDPLLYISGDKVITEDITFEDYTDVIKFNNSGDILSIVFSETNSTSTTPEEISIIVNKLEFLGGELEFSLSDGTSFDETSDEVLFENKVFNIYVLDYITLQTPNTQVISPEINIFLVGNSTLSITGNAEPEAGIFVYGPEAIVEMNSNQASFKGAMIVDTFRKNSNIDEWQGSFTYQKPSNHSIFKNIIPFYHKGIWSR